MSDELDVVELTRELVRIPSETGHEGAVGDLIASRLSEAGWLVDRQDIPGALGADGRFNVLARLRDAPPKVVLTTHIDVVPPHVELSEDDDALFGRGTCDAKGIFAAMWVAAERLRAAGRDDVALLAVVGEETDSIGAKRVHELLPKADWIVDGEPTQMVLTTAAKGVLLFCAQAKGIAGHSAYPERGDSAIHHLVAALQRLLEAELAADPEFGSTTVNVGRVQGGAAANVIAPSASADVIIRLGAPLAKVLPQVEAALGSKISIDIKSKSEPLRMHVPEGLHGVPVSFGSDVPYLQRIGTPLLVGPGSIHDAHTATEKIGKQELRQAVESYVDLCQRLLSSPASGASA